MNAALVKDFVDEWKQPTAEASEVLTAQAEKALKDFAASHAQLARFPALQRRFALALHTARQRASEQLGRELHRLLERERTPSTENHYLMDTLAKIRNDRLVSACRRVFPAANNYTGKAVIEQLKQVCVYIHTYRCVYCLDSHTYIYIAVHVRICVILLMLHACMHVLFLKLN